MCAWVCRFKLVGPHRNAGGYESATTPTRRTLRRACELPAERGNRADHLGIAAYHRALSRSRASPRGAAGAVRPLKARVPLAFPKHVRIHHLLRLFYSGLLAMDGWTAFLSRIAIVTEGSEIRRRQRLGVQACSVRRGRGRLRWRSWRFTLTARPETPGAHCFGVLDPPAERSRRGIPEASDIAAARRKSSSIALCPSGPMRIE